MIVNTAAIVVEDTSSRRIRIKANIINTSCTSAIIDEIAYENLNLTQM